jgi:hypothetical protein
VRGLPSGEASRQGCNFTTKLRDVREKSSFMQAKRSGAFTGTQGTAVHKRLLDKTRVLEILGIVFGFIRL